MAIRAPDGANNVNDNNRELEVELAKDGGRQTSQRVHQGLLGKNL